MIKTAAAATKHAEDFAQPPAAPVARTTGRNAEDAWEQVTLDRPLYKPESCKGTPLQGYLIRVEDMPPNDNGPWRALVVRTTAPVLAVLGLGEDADVPREFAVGTDVLLPVTIKLRSLVQYLHPRVLLEIRIAPRDKVRVPGGNPMWTYQATVNKSSAIARPAHLALAPASAAPALGRGSAAGQPGEDDLPF